MVVLLGQTCDDQTNTGSKSLIMIDLGTWSLAGRRCGLFSLLFEHASDSETAGRQHRHFHQSPRQTTTDQKIDLGRGPFQPFPNRSAASVQSRAVTAKQESLAETQVIVHEPLAPIIRPVRQPEAGVRGHRGRGHRSQQFVLVMEVPIQRWLFDAESLRQHARADLIKADLIKQIKRCGDNQFPSYLTHN